MPRFFVYGRISHADQEAGDSVPAQKQRGGHHWQDNFQAQGVEWGGIFEEPGHVSASSVPFMRRKAGKEAIITLQKGDVLYVDKVDRLWRDIHDFSDLLRWFKNHEIRLVFGNMLGATFEMDSPMGEFMLPLLVLIGQLESAQTSDRIKRCFAHEKENGFFPRPASAAPMGTKAVTAIPYAPNKLKKPKKMLVWDMPTRLIMAEIVKLHDVDKLDWFAISDRITLQVEGYLPAYEKSRKWRAFQCVWAYAIEKHYALVQNPRYMDCKSIPTLLGAMNTFGVGMPRNGGEGGSQRRKRA